MGACGQANRSEGDLLRSHPSGVPLGMDGWDRRGRMRPHERWTGLSNRRRLDGAEPPQYLALCGVLGWAEPPQYLTAYRYHPIAGGYRVVYGVGRATGSIRGA